MPSSPSPSSPRNTRFTTAFELRHLILDERMGELVNRVFQDDGVSSAYLRHYSFIAQTIARLEYALDQVHEEQNEIYNHLMASPQFRHTLRPVIQTYRQRQRQSNSQPYTHSHRPLNRRESPNSLPSSSSSQPSSNDSSTRPPHPSPDAQPGSSINPIDVDADKDNDNDKTKIMGTTDQYGRRLTHIDGSGPPNSESMCERCSQYGHEKSGCNTKIRSFLFCDTCRWLGRQQDNCDHYDLSPVDCRKLRGDIPYDDSD